MYLAGIIRKVRERMLRMRYKKKCFAALLGTLLAIQCMPFVPLPVSAESESLPEQTVTGEQIRSAINFLLTNTDDIKLSINESFDINSDGCINAIDVTLLKQQFLAQQEKAIAHYCSISELIQENDGDQNSDEIHSMRVIVRTEADKDFSCFRPTNVISGSDHIYVLQFESAEQADNCVDALLGSEGIVYVEHDDYISQTVQPSAAGDAASADSLSWGVKAMGADLYADYLHTNYDGSVVVAVIDTGVAPHSFIGDRLLPGYDFVDSDDDPYDLNSHGTHVAGTVVDCTPGLNVKILPLRVLNKSGFGSYLNIGNAIRYAADHGANVINLSLSGKGCSNYMDDSVDYAIAHGVTVVCAAGNDSKNTAEYCPPHIKDCIVVAACDAQYDPAYFTNYGSSVDVIGPGVSVLSSVPGEEYAVLSGTSMSTPHIAAAAAMVKIANPQMSPAEIAELLKKTCLDLGDPGWDPIYGSGFPQLQELIKETSDITPELSISETSATLSVGEQLHLTESHIPKVLDVVWSSSNSKILTVEDGTVRAIAAGTATVTATVFNGKRNASANCKVTVTNSSDTILSSGSCGENITYTLDGNGLLTLSGTGKTDRYSSPGYSKLTIGGEIRPESPFANDARIKRIKVEEGITALSDGVFYGCSSLFDVELPASLTAIENGALGGCTALEEICLPSGLKTIAGVSQQAYCAFMNSTSLKKITVDPENPDFADDDGALISKDGKTLYYIPYAKTDYIIKDGVQTLSFGCAYQHTELRELILPQSVTTIQDWAFRECTNLSAVALGNGVRKIGQYAFYQTALTSVNIPYSVMEIGRYAFGECQLNNAVFDMRGTLPLYVSSDAFNENSGLEELLLPERLSEIGSSLLHCDVPAVKMRNPAVHLNKDSFSQQTVLYSYSGSTAEAYAAANEMEFVNLDSDYTQKTNGVFGNGYTWSIDSDGVLSISLDGDMLTYEGITFSPYAPWALAGNRAKAVQLDGTPSSICNYAFSNMPLLESAAFPETVKTIGRDVFTGSGIKEVTIPESVQKISEYAFRGADQIEKVTFLPYRFSWDYMTTLHDVLPEDAVICGHSGSTAETFAKKFNHTFIPLE